MAPPTLTIAISGSSSSGKTTTAILLAEIFSESNGFLKADRRISALEFIDSENTATATPQKIVPVPVVIHEDAFFIDGKTYCPNKSFSTTPNDIRFVCNTLSHDHPTYTIIFDSDTSSSLQRSSDENSNTLVYKPTWSITGPDTDCYEALHIPDLIEAIQHVRTTGLMSEAALRRIKYTQKNFPALLLTEEERQAIINKWADLIHEMQRFVKNWTHEQIQSRRAAAGAQEVARPAVCFVEGFLLYPDPAHSAPGHQHRSPDIGPAQHINGRPSHRPTISTARILTPILNSASSSRASKRNSLTSQAITQARDAAFQASNKKARGGLISQFDLKLFLPTSEHQSKSRRFVRPCYVDAPNGKREPGQMWKTEGYFNDVAWPNYVRDHRWLFEGGRIEGEGGRISGEGDGDSDEAEEVMSVHAGRDKRVCTPSELAKNLGVDIRREEDADVETTVQWALEKILGDLERRDWVVADEDIPISEIGPEDSDMAVLDGAGADADMDAGSEPVRKWYQKLCCF